MTADMPAAGASVPCWVPRESRPWRCGVITELHWLIPRGRSRSPGTCPRGRSARPPRSIASSARWPICWSSTASRRCRPATSRRADSRARRTCPTRISAPPAASRRTPARRARSAASMSMPSSPSLANPAPAAGVRMEYESLFALGSLCGVDDPDAVLHASSLCDQHGLDTISTGGTIAFLMECVERGWVNGHLPESGRELRFGDSAALIEGSTRSRAVGASWALFSRWGAGGRPNGSAAPHPTWHRRSRDSRCPATIPGVCRRWPWDSP